MAGEWKLKKVAEIAHVIGGGTPKTKKPEYWGGDIAWLTPKDLSGEHPRYVSHGERNITKAGLGNSSTRIVPPKTVLLTSRAPIGYVAMAKNPITTNQGFRNLVVNDENDPNFVYYLLLNNTDYLKQHAAGSTFQELSGSTLKSLEFLIPPLSEQKAIADVLGSLDDKIELNRKMNETLEAMARAIFKSWFVDAVKDGLPKDWKESTVSEEFNLTMGQSPPGETYNDTGDGIPFYQGRADFGFRYPSVRMFCTTPTRFAKAGDTLVSVRAPVGSVNMARGRCCIGRGVAAVRHKSGSRSYSYYSMCAIQTEFEQFEAEGTVFGSINKADFRQIGCVAPPAKTVDAFEERVFPIDQQIENNENQSRTLAALRDALLPKLLSGEIRVNEAANLGKGCTNG